MSRSRRKTPICGFTTSDSEKLAKRIANRKMRRRVKNGIRRGDELITPLFLRETVNAYWMPKDGKSWWGRKVLEPEWSYLMRK